MSEYENMTCTPDGVIDTNALKDNARSIAFKAINAKLAKERV